MNQAIVGTRIWCLVLALWVGWTSIGWSQAITLVQDDTRPLVGTDSVYPSDLPSVHPQKSFMAWMIRSSGIFGYIIMLVSFAMVAIILMIAAQLRRDNYLPSPFISEFEQQLQAKDYQGAYDSAKASDSLIGRILAAGISCRPRGHAAAIDQMQQVGDGEAMAMEHKIGYLALIGSIAPMLGLLGTVQGMVFCFWAIANSTISPKPAELADGIATASLTTLEGLVVAIPAIVFSSLYRNRLARFLMECGFVAENLMKNFDSMDQLPSSGVRIGGAAAANAPVGSRID